MKLIVLVLVALASVASASIFDLIPKCLVLPRFECADKNPDGSLTAHFGYRAWCPFKNKDSTKIKVGSLNAFYFGFTRNPQNRGQPTVFEEGVHTCNFSIIIPADDALQMEQRGKWRSFSKTMFWTVTLLWAEVIPGKSCKRTENGQVDSICDWSCYIEEETCLAQNKTLDSTLCQCVNEGVCGDTFETSPCGLPEQGSGEFEMCNPNNGECTSYQSMNLALLIDFFSSEDTDNPIDTSEIVTLLVDAIKSLQITYVLNNGQLIFNKDQIFITQMTKRVDGVETYEVSFIISILKDLFKESQITANDLVTDILQKTTFLNDLSIYCQTSGSCDLAHVTLDAYLLGDDGNYLSQIKQEFSQLGSSRNSLPSQMLSVNSVYVFIGIAILAAIVVGAVVGIVVYKRKTGKVAPPVDLPHPSGNVDWVPPTMRYQSRPRSASKEPLNK